MNDARFDRPRVGDAPGDLMPVTETGRTADEVGHDVVSNLDWTRTTRGRSDAPLLMHWVDEKGAVVRLISSSSEDAEVRGT